jgi:hypothetical protein
MVFDKLDEAACEAMSMTIDSDVEVHDAVRQAICCVTVYVAEWRTQDAIRAFIFETVHSVTAALEEM